MTNFGQRRSSIDVTSESGKRLFNQPLAMGPTNLVNFNDTDGLDPLEEDDSRNMELFKH
jgi:hypothetical protein